MQFNRRRTGGAVAGRAAGSAGRKVALVERKNFGAPASYRCMPTKTLVASAYAPHLARARRLWCDYRRPDSRSTCRRVKARQDETCAMRARPWSAAQGILPNASVFEGHARFESATTLRVNDFGARGRPDFINAWARAGPAHARAGHGEVFHDSTIWTSIFFFDPSICWSSAASYIGLEFGRCYRRLARKYRDRESTWHHRPRGCGRGARACWKFCAATASLSKPAAECMKC